MGVLRLILGLLLGSRLVGAGPELVLEAINLPQKRHRIEFLLSAPQLVFHRPGDPVVREKTLTRCLGAKPIERHHRSRGYVDAHALNDAVL
jgi:hypothetical protein